MFRYLTPREGTETNITDSVNSVATGLDALLPARGRKLTDADSESVEACRSDTLLPERGRKQVTDYCLTASYLVQIPCSPRGA